MKHVIYVEESPILRETLSAALDINGFRVTTCGDARTAWGILRTEGCDLLLLDIELRSRSGLALLRKVRDELPLPARRMPVVVLTACTSVDTIREAIEFRPRKLLVKSNFSLDRLLEVIRESTDETSAASRAAAAADNAAAAPPTPNTEPRPDAGTDAGTDMDANHASGVHATSDAPAEPAAPASMPIAAPPITRDQLSQMEPLLSRRETSTIIAKAEPLEPSLPPTARAVRAALALSGGDAQVVGALVKDDALCARVAFIAAADRGEDGPVPDAGAAIVSHFGADRVREAIMVACVFDRFGGVAEELVAPGPFWCHVLTVARIARDLATSHDHVSPTQAFAAGLLHDLGRLVMAETARSPFSAMLSLANRVDEPLENLEAKMLGMSHADVVADLVDGWIFGHGLGPILRLHHGTRQELEQLDRDDVPLALVLALADRLAHAHLAGDPRHDRVAATEDLARALHLDASHADRAGDGVADWTAAMAAAASDGAIKPISAEGPLREALGDGPIRPLMLPRDAQGDASRVCIRRMLSASGRTAPPMMADDSAAAEGPPPNLAIIRLRSKVDIRGEIARLRELEPFPDHAPLPLLVLADDAAAANAEELTGRRVTVLELPVRAMELAQSLAELALADEDLDAASQQRAAA